MKAPTTPNELDIRPLEPVKEEGGGTNNGPAENPAEEEHSEKENGSAGEARNSTSPTEDTAKEEPEKIEKRQSRSESIRAKLRAQERRLTNLVRSSNRELDVIGQMKTAQKSLELVAAEKSELEKELEKLKNSTDHDDFLKDQMTGIQQGFEKQVEKIKSLQDESMAKNHEIDTLRTELVRKLQRIVELEFDLETHAIHYTSYASDQFKLGEKALEEIKGGGGDDPDTSESTGADASHGSDINKNTNNKPLTAKNAQKLISKLLTDLEDLEERYKHDKLKSVSTLEGLRLESDEMRTEIMVLKQRLGTEKGKQTNASLEEHSLVQLWREIETSEAKKELLLKEVAKLRAKVEDTEKGASEEAKRKQLEVDLLTNENESMKVRISQLEAKSSAGGLLRKKKKVEKPDKFNEIELRLKETYGDLGKLRTSVEIKDKQISTLKQEVANLRMRDISDGNTKDTMYTEFDTDLLKVAPRLVDRSVRGLSFDASGESSAANCAYMADLQRHLQDVQHQLVKKDQELVIERAKAASTAAGLLARINDLTRKKEVPAEQILAQFYS